MYGCIYSVLANQWNLVTVYRPLLSPIVVAAAFGLIGVVWRLHVSVAAGGADAGCGPAAVRDWRLRSLPGVCGILLVVVGSVRRDWVVTIALVEDSGGAAQLGQGGFQTLPCMLVNPTACIYLEKAGGCKVSLAEHDHRAGYDRQRGWRVQRQVRPKKRTFKL